MLRVTVNLNEQESKALSVVLQHIVSSNRNQGIRYALLDTAKKILATNTNVLVNKETTNG